MLRYIITKILNKYKLYMCLVIGIVSIVMVFAMIMMFRDGSRSKLIQRGFVSQNEKTHQFPMTLSRKGILRASVFEELSETERAVDVIDKDIQAYEASWDKYMQLPIVGSQRIVSYENISVDYPLYNKNGHLDLCYMEEGLGKSGKELSEHYDIVSGVDLYEDVSEYLPEGTDIPEGAIPCLISQYTADSLSLVPGTLITSNKLVYGQSESEDNLLTLYVSGIISETKNDYYWQTSLLDMGYGAFISKDDFETIAKKYPKDIYYNSYMSFDYRYVTPGRIYEIDNVLEQFKAKDETLVENTTPIVDEYRKDSKSVEQMLYVIVLPLIVLVLIFIGMIAFRIIDSEDGELTTLKNRGLSKARLIGLYVIQSFLLAGISIPLGLGLGFLFGKVVASVTDFMGFSLSGNGISVRDYRFSISMLLSALVAALLAVIVMLIPVFVYFKKKKNRRKNSLAPSWEKYFIDVILLAISVYLMYNYNKQVQTLSKGVLNGDGIDPIIFINSSLFLFACGMLMLRLIFYLVKLYYKMGAKRFKPVTYAGILQILRTRKASSIISIFLVMTVAMSLFNANMARTINKNKEERIRYSVGADIRIKEHWNAVIVGPPEDRRWKFNEPDYNPYESLVKDGTFSSITRVLVSDRATLKVKGKETPDVTFMAIHTKEFGETAFLREGLTEEHWFNYLNKLAAEVDGVIISENLASLFDLKVGDSLNCDMYPPKQTGLTSSYAHTDYKIVAIVDSWPGYNKYKYEYNNVDGKFKISEKENYLAVVNYGNAISHFGVLPYEVWGKAEDGIKGDGREADIVNEKVKEAFPKKSRYLDEVISWRDEVKEAKASAILQITNGLFTADFLIALILCIIGYMIYWITSIRDRELLFGIYRAMGISKGEINNMLGMEQIFMSLMSIFAGIVAGMLASKFFVKIFAAVYLPERHNIDVFTSSYGGDLIKLAAALLIVILVCVFWIRRIVRGLNITEALKLGDD